MTNRGDLGRLAGKMAGWAFLPFTQEFGRHLQLYRDARAALEAIRAATLMPSGTTSDADVPYTPEQRDAIQARTCRRAHLFGVLLTGVLLWWAKLLLVNREGLLSLSSAECLMLGLMTGAQMLAQAFLNWRIRGGRGGMTAFLSGGAGRWPR